MKSIIKSCDVFKKQIMLKILAIIVSYPKMASMLFGLEKILQQEIMVLDAFNPAEMTIALGILGIVAMHTLPGFIENNEKKSLMIKLQRDYSVYTNGVNQAISENGSPDMWSKTDQPISLTDINDVLSGYFKVIKNCENLSGCFPDFKYKNLKGIYNETVLNSDDSYTKFKLIDGTSIAINLWSNQCDLDWGDGYQLNNVCGTLVMDLNGEKRPNTYGIDFFGFAFTRYGLVPLGSQNQSAFPLSAFCSTTSNANFKYENGLSCTAWVLYNKNMDYLDCKGLNWGTKTTCG